jgi:glycosyltransferase involved in cell wall biosynthesis
VRNAAETLPECLESLAAQTLADHEVVAVDDGSEDYDLAAVGQKGARERIRAEAARLGLVEGENLLAVA